MARVFVPRDATALSLGAERVARALARHAPDLEIVRTGSRGAMWLEPLVEVEIDGVRHGYGPISEGDVPGLLAAGFLDGRPHPLALGPVETLDWFARQQRLTFARCGIVDPLDLDDYRRNGGLRGLERALALAPEAIVEEVAASGLRGRGGAGFPTGIKWRTVAAQPPGQKYVVCNADEGDSGTFADRMLLEGDPFALIEGMVIAGIAVGADKGFVYLRSEYPNALAILSAAIAVAEADGLLGRNVQGSAHSFSIEIRCGAGAYVCGEETALLESLEGRRGQVRPKPPLPAISGLFGKPTIINNLVTLASVPVILDKGAAFYRDFGMGRSRGTSAMQLGGNVARGGLVEIAFGATLRQLVEEFGGGTASGRPVRAVQVGGPLGAYIPPHLLDVALDYEALAGIQAMLGHGGVVVFDDSVDMGAQARFAMEFCAIESCGKCTPCRIGSTRGVEIIDRILAGEAREANVALLDDLCATMTDGSLCALGGLTPMPVLSALRHFPEDFERPRTARAAE